MDTPPGHPSIDECHNIHSRAIHTLSILSDTPTIFVKKHTQQPTTIDYNKLKPYFGWVNAETIQETFEDGVGPCLDGPIVTLRRILILMIRFRMPTTAVVHSEDVFNFIGNFNLTTITD